jgi:hypothetical protein
MLGYSQRTFTINELLLGLQRFELMSVDLTCSAPVGYGHLVVCSFNLGVVDLLEVLWYGDSAHSDRPKFYSLARESAAGFLIFGQVRIWPSLVKTMG